MGEKEKNFLGALGLLVSIVILLGIIYRTIDVDGIKATILGNKVINCLIENKFDNVSCENLETLNKIKENQENINRMLGEIKNYKYAGTYRGKNIDEENNIFVEYDVNYSKYYDENVKVILMFKYSDNNLSLSQCNLQPENNVSAVSNIINGLKPVIEEKTKDVDKAKELVVDVSKKFDNGDYKQIYSILSDELKEHGKEKEFIDFLIRQHNKYGDISNIKFDGYEISKGKSEYKLKYYLEGDKKIYITFWVKNKDKLYLSGINFSENMW